MMTLLLLLCACHKTSDVDTGPQGDTGAETQDPSTPVAAATDGTFQAAFGVDVDAVGTDRIDDLAVVAGAVDLGFKGGTHLGFAYQSHDWSGWRLFDLFTLASDGSDLAVTWVYADADGLVGAYTESFFQPMSYEVLEGTVLGTDDPTSIPVVLPPLVVTPPTTPSGFTIDGDGIWLEDTAGTATVGSQEWGLLPFGTVDCADCPGGPWYEIHALLTGVGEACFGILYLFPTDPTVVQLSYGICLPDLSTLETSWTGTWTGAPARPMPMALRPPPRSRSAGPR